MPDVLPGVPAEFANLPSVRMVPPPDVFMSDVVKLLDDATADLGTFNNRLAWIATEKGVNVAVISKFHDGERWKLNVGAYFAKEWGQPYKAGLMGSLRF